MKKILWVAIIATISCMLLIACTDEIKNDFPADTAESSVLATDGVLIDPDVRYFTLEDFASIVIGESTMEDIINITGIEAPVAMMSPGGVSEYPMKDGKCIRVEYISEEFVVYDIKVATPIMKQQGNSIKTDIDSHAPVDFADYEKLIAFCRSETAQPIHEIYTSKEIKAYIQNIRDGNIPLMIPCYAGKPYAALNVKPPFFTPIHILYTLFFGIGYETIINEEEVNIFIYPLSAEEFIMVDEKSCSELIAVLKPMEPNVDNYDSGKYERIFEDSAVIDGISRSMLVQHSKNGMETIYFVLDGCIVEFYAPTGTVTKDWLKDFSVVAY